MTINIQAKTTELNSQQQKALAEICELLIQHFPDLSLKNKTAEIYIGSTIKDNHNKPRKLALEITSSNLTLESFAHKPNLYSIH